MWGVWLVYHLILAPGHRHSQKCNSAPGRRSDQILARKGQMRSININIANGVATNWLSVWTLPIPWTSHNKQLDEMTKNPVAQLGVGLNSCVVRLHIGANLYCRANWIIKKYLYDVRTSLDHHSRGQGRLEIIIQSMHSSKYSSSPWKSLLACLSFAANHLLTWFWNDWDGACRTDGKNKK